MFGYHMTFDGTCSQIPALSTIQEGSKYIPEERPTLKSMITYEPRKMEIGSFPTIQQAMAEI